MRSVLSTAVFLLVASCSARAAATAQVPAAADAQPAKPQEAIASSVSVLLGASARLADMWARYEARLAERPSHPDEAWAESVTRILDEGVSLDYPSNAPPAREARLALLRHGRAALPAILEELGACDVASQKGQCRASFAARVLEEIAGGGFGWSFGTEPPHVEANRKVIASWNELWRRAGDDTAFWTLRYGLDEAKAVRIVEGTTLAFVDNELVMPLGTRIRVGSAEEAIEVAAEQGFERTYTWKGVSRSVLMIARHERWYGGLGLYFPGPGNHWEEHQGITRGVVQEGQLHFQTQDEALAWIREPRKWKETRYRNDGLVVAWGRDPVTLYAEVWQITIAGKRPTELPGSDDAAITVTRSPR